MRLSTIVLFSHPHCHPSGLLSQLLRLFVLFLFFCQSFQICWLWRRKPGVIYQIISWKKWRLIVFRTKIWKTCPAARYIGRDLMKDLLSIHIKFCFRLSKLEQNFRRIRLLGDRESRIFLNNQSYPKYMIFDQWDVWCRALISNGSEVKFEARIRNTWWRYDKNIDVCLCSFVHEKKLSHRFSPN